MNCCGENALFVLQRSEYGICYAFNSVLNQQGSSRYVKKISFQSNVVPIVELFPFRMPKKNESNYPLRTAKFGDWSGIRATIRVNDSTKIPHIKRRSGVLV